MKTPLPIFWPHQSATVKQRFYYNVIISIHAEKMQDFGLVLLVVSVTQSSIKFSRNSFEENRSKFIFTLI